MKKFFAVILTFNLLIFFSMVLNISELKAEDTATTDTTPSEVVYNPDTDIVAKVNDYEISYTQLQVSINNRISKLAYHKYLTERRREAVEKETLEFLIIEQLLYEEGINRSFTVSKREVKDSIRNFQKNLPKGMTLKKVLKQSNMTKDELKEIFRRKEILNRINTESSKELSKKVEELVSEEFIRKYYDDNNEKFKEPSKIHISEILLTADPGGGRDHWLEVRTQIVKIEERIRGGEDFAEVAKEVSQDPYATKGGDLGWAHSGTLDEGLERVANTLEAGEISGPTESLYGYHLIKLHEKKIGGLKPYEDLNHEKLKKELIKSNYRKLEKEWHDSLREKAVIEYFDAE